jgi:hypothetical protein
VPNEKGSTVGIYREILLPVLGGALIASTGNKQAQEEVTILKTIHGCNWMA